MIPNLAVIVSTYAVARLLMLGLIPAWAKPSDARVANAVISGIAIAIIGYFCLEIVNAANNLAPLGV